MARLNLPLSKAELRATGDLPQLSYDEQVVFSPYLPQNKYAFRKGGRWSGILRLGTQHDPAAITAIDAWLDQLATQEIQRIGRWLCRRWIPRCPARWRYRRCTRCKGSGWGCGLRR